MPNEKIEITKQEKESIIQRHKLLVDEFNSYLPKDKQLSYDDKLEEKLEDPAVVKYYLTLRDLRAKLETQRDIQTELSAKYPIPDKKLTLPRTFVYGLNPAGNDVSKMYNDKLYKSYQEDPEKVFYQRVHKVLSFNPQKLYDIIDDKQKLVEFYLENQELCEDAYAILSIVTNADVKVNPALRENISKISKGFEILAYPANLAKMECGAKNLVFPELTKEQAEIIMEKNPTFLLEGAPYKLQFNNLLTEFDEQKATKEYLEKFVNAGLKFEDGFFTKYKAQQLLPGATQPVEISLEAGLDSINGVKPLDGQISIVPREPNEVYEMNKVNDTFNREYLKIWQKNFSKNYDNKSFNLDGLIDKNKGNFVERWLGKTSPEYTAFVEALRDFNDPKSPNYLNKELLKQRGNAYIDHKAEQGKSLDRMDATGRERVIFVSAVIQTIDQMEYNKEGVTAQINNILKPSNVVRELYLDPKLVEDNTIENYMDQNLEPQAYTSIHDQGNKIDNSDMEISIDDSDSSYYSEDDGIGNS